MNNPGSIFSPLVTAFDQVVSEADEGTTLSLSSGLAFDEMVSHLTDGIDQNITLWQSVASGHGAGAARVRLESVLFPGVSLNNVDLAGYDITSFSLKFDSIDTYFDNTSFFSVTNTTLTINGTLASVSEPSALYLLCLGLAGVGVARRKKIIS